MPYTTIILSESDLQLVKTWRGIVSFAAVIGATLLILTASASAQVEPLECLPGSTGPIPGDAASFGGGMCDLGSLVDDNLSTSSANALSADGAVIVGAAAVEGSGSRAFRWIEGVNSNRMLDLGSLRNDDSGSSSASAVSANGTVIVGASETEDNSTRAFRWIEGVNSNRMLDLGSLRNDNFGSSFAKDVSADGAVIVGRADTEGFRSRAFRWIEGVNNNRMLDLGTLRTDNLQNSFANAVSADGAVIVGRAETDDGSNRAFRWIEGVNSNRMLDLGSLRTDNLRYSSASAVSADGAVIVGEAVNQDGDDRAFRWIEGVNSNRMLDLGSLRSDNSGRSAAIAVSADGAVIVGRARTDDGNSRAFRWIEGVNSNRMLDLGSLRTDPGDLGSNSALAVSADGAVIVGQSGTDDRNSRAYRWIDDGNGMLDLGSLRDDNLGYSTPSAVSADGAVIVGQAETDDGSSRAFIWRTQMQDLGNLMLSFPVLANDTEIAVAQQQHVLGRLMSDTCLAEEGQACLSSGGTLANTGATGSQDIDSRKSGIGTLTYGRGLDGQTTIGGTLSVNGTSLSAHSFDMGTSVGVSLWGEYSEDGLVRTGWQASSALGWGRESGIVTRGRGLDRVMLATGEASLETLKARATLGYGFQQQDWLITPSAKLAHFHTSRSAYAEHGADFNASYDALSVNRTIATLALSGERQITEQSTLMLGIGVEHDLSANRAVLTGASTVPGMESFSVGSTLERRDTRGFLDIGYTQDLGNNRSLSENFRAGQSAFGSALQLGVGIGYNMRF